VPAPAGEIKRVRADLAALAASFAYADRLSRGCGLSLTPNHHGGYRRPRKNGGFSLSFAEKAE